jgi:hypothetical protein
MHLPSEELLAVEDSHRAAALRASNLRGGSRPVLPRRVRTWSGGLQNSPASILSERR